jgi:hypothetical protein
MILEGRYFTAYGVLVIAHNQSLFASSPGLIARAWEAGTGEHRAVSSGLWQTGLGAAGGAPIDFGVMLMRTVRGGGLALGKSLPGRGLVMLEMT